MIILNGGTDKLQIVLESAVASTQPTWQAYWARLSSGDLVSYRLTSGSANSTTSVDVISGSVTNQYILKSMSVHNLDSTDISFTVKKDVGGAAYPVFSSVLSVSQSAHYEDGRGWETFLANGRRRARNQITKRDFQRFETAGFHTWTKPTMFNPTYVEVVCIGGGGGGGGGAFNVEAGTHIGGSGGGGGAYNRRIFLASELGSSEVVYVGAGGTGGAAGSGSAGGSDAGTTGVTGSLSYFGTDGALLKSYGGGGGYGGSVSSTTKSGGGGGGTGGTGANGAGASVAGGVPGVYDTLAYGGTGAGCFTTTPGVAEYGGGSGGTNNSSGGSSLFGGGGGGDSGATSTNSYDVGASGGSSCSYSSGGGGSGGSATATAAWDGLPGINGCTLFAGSGGGGGGFTSADDVRGGSGGDGGSGGGGGGGGAARATLNLGGPAGDGGNGGCGAVYIFTR